MNVSYEDETFTQVTSVKKGDGELTEGGFVFSEILNSITRFGNFKSFLGIIICEERFVEQKAY